MRVPEYPKSGAAQTPPGRVSAAGTSVLFQCCRLGLQLFNLLAQ